MHASPELHRLSAALRVPPTRPRLCDLGIEPKPAEERVLRVRDGWALVRCRGWLLGVAHHGSRVRDEGCTTLPGKKGPKM